MTDAAAGWQEQYSLLEPLFRQESGLMAILVLLSAFSLGCWNGDDRPADLGALQTTPYELRASPDQTASTDVQRVDDA